MGSGSSRAQSIIPPGSPENYYSTGRVETHLAPSRERRQVVVGLPAAHQGGGEMWVQPSVDVFTDRVAPASSGPFGVGSLTSARHPLDSSGPVDGPPLEALPIPGGSSEDTMYGQEYLPMDGDMAATPIFDGIVGSEPRAGARGGFWSGLFYGQPAGIGRERVLHAPFEIDTTQPFGNFAVKTNMVTNQTFPDRAEFFWARTGTRGPLLPESAVNYQEVRLKLELGKGKFSTTTEVPFRWVDPERNANHAGLGDLTTATKVVLVDGKSWQITQFFKSYFSTGSPRMGLGTGHIALEPGFLFRYRWSDFTFLHSEVKYQFPLGADPLFASEILRYGFGISHLWLENDQVAVIPTFELVGWSISGGLATDPFGFPVSSDGVHIFNFYPGLRLVHDTNCDLGLLEFGVRGGFPVTPRRWHDGSVAIEVRWSF
ncbi:MAG: hypothetical protein WD070_04040 [Pirellulaceae bacterium]